MSMDYQPRSSDDEPAEYNRQLETFQSCFADKLESVIRDLPLPEGARVLDAPCGSGFYTRLLARKVGVTGEVHGADLSPGLLEDAVERRRPPGAASMVLTEADAYQLPFPDDWFDLVWCAQSLISLDEPVRALRELARVLKPGGLQVILETDELHHVLLPWPVEFELALGTALYQASKARYERPSALFLGRSLGQLLSQAGLRVVERRTHVVDLAAPFAPAVGAFLEEHLRCLADLARPHLDGKAGQMLEDFTCPDSAGNLLAREDLQVTCLFSTCRGQKARGRLE